LGDGCEADCGNSAAAARVESLAFRRDTQVATPETKALQHALDGADQVFTAGLVLQELLQGFAGP
jgi:hypothetical protein